MVRQARLSLPFENSCAPRAVQLAALRQKQQRRAQLAGYQIAFRQCLTGYGCRHGNRAVTADFDRRVLDRKRQRFDQHRRDIVLRDVKFHCIALLGCGRRCAGIRPAYQHISQHQQAQEQAYALRLRYRLRFFASCMAGAPFCFLQQLMRELGFICVLSDAELEPTFGWEVRRTRGTR